MSPYSIPLCTIFTKWPAPSGPTCVTHGPESLFAAIASKTGLMHSHDSFEPPGMRDGPKRAPSSPPETPEPTKCSPFASHSFVRRCVSLKNELPPSMRTSPFSRCGAIFSMVMSTGSPALIIIMIRRGRSSDAANSSNVFVPTSCLPGCFATKRSTHSPSRFQTATGKPCSSTLSARFSPITPRPIMPNDAFAIVTPHGARASSPAVGERLARRPLRAGRDARHVRTRRPRSSCLHYRVLHHVRERLQSRVDVAAEVHAQRAPIARLQRLEVADRLRAAEHTEREFLARQRDVLASAAGELQEDAVVGAAFVQLSGRMEEARSVAGGRRDVQLARDRLADRGDLLVALRRFGEVLGERDVIARLHLRQQRADRFRIVRLDLRAGRRHRPARRVLAEQF